MKPKYIIMRNPIFLMFCIIQTHFLYGQCSVGCTATLTGNSTTNITVDDGEVLCIEPAGGDLTFSHEFL